MRIGLLDSRVWGFRAENTKTNLYPRPILKTSHRLPCLEKPNQLHPRSQENQGEPEGASKSRQEEPGVGDIVRTHCEHLAFASMDDMKGPNEVVPFCVPLAFCGGALLRHPAAVRCTCRFAGKYYGLGFVGAWRLGFRASERLAIQVQDFPARRAFGI